MKQIVLDTNFLMYAAKYKIDVVTELDRICNFAYKIVLPEQVLNELIGLGTSKKVTGKDREAALLALQLVKNIEILKIPGKNADDALLKVAQGTILATMDKELRKRFKKDKRGKLISIRQKKYLIFI